ncbi:Cwp2p PWA37_001541 [Arxiozyma heterogenica]|uniref:Cwp2p n=1 Tax=Arxiozyma heterogenica TaxID=278026 RepID=UPI002F1757C3
MQFTTAIVAATAALINYVSAESVVAISQITDGQIQATHTAASASHATASSSAHTTATVSQFSSNGAAKAVAGLGAGVAAAAAFLL